MAPPVFKTGLAANIVAGGFDSLPPPPSICVIVVTETARSRRLTIDVAIAPETTQ